MRALRRPGTFLKVVSTYGSWWLLFFLVTCNFCSNVFLSINKSNVAKIYHKTFTHSVGQGAILWTQIAITTTFIVNNRT